MDTVRVYDKQELENINKVLRKDKNNKYFTQQELEVANEINQRKEDKCMNNNMMIFKNDNFGEIRSLEINGEPYFVGKDIAEVLGYSNTRKAIQDHVDEDDKLDGVTICDSIGRNQSAIAINESGLYSLIMSSKLPKAKLFKRWVTSEVLPSIRKNGSYELDTNGLMKQLTESQITLNNVLAGFKMQIDNDFKIANEKITEHDELLKKRVYLSPKEAKDVQIAIKNKAKQIAIEFDLPYHTVKGKLFKRLYTSLNEIFEVGTYRELPSIKYEDIMHTISGLTIGIRDIQNEVYQTSLYN